jgi:diphthamide biosynthesis protein 2
MHFFFFFPLFFFFFVIVPTLQFASFDPETGASQHIAAGGNKALMRRYFLVQKAKEAQVIGILAGTLAVASYVETIAALQSLAAAAGKTTYLFVVGKINEAKLANFMEVDLFVLVACPENSLVRSEGSVPSFSFLFTLRSRNTLIRCGAD